MTSADAKRSARLDPSVALASTIRRDGLTEAEAEEFMARAGTAIAASSEVDGDDRAVRAAVAAISQLPAAQLKRAGGILVDVLGPGDLTLPEAHAAAEAIQQAAGADAEVLYSEIRDERMEGAVWVTVIACSIE